MNQIIDTPDAREYRTKKRAYLLKELEKLNKTEKEIQKKLQEKKN